MTIALAIVALLALLVAAAGGIWFLVNAFRTHILWGVLCCVFTPACIRFSFLHWDMARRPLCLTAIGAVLAFGCGHFLRQSGTEWGDRIAHLTRSGGEAPEHKKHALPAMFEAQKQMELQIRLVALQKRENDLLERKAGLDPKDRAGAVALTAEIKKYNDDLKPVLQDMRDRGMVAAQ
jgi:hypothetical protein